MDDTTKCEVCGRVKCDPKASYVFPAARALNLCHSGATDSFAFLTVECWKIGYSRLSAEVEALRREREEVLRERAEYRIRFLLSKQRAEEAEADAERLREALGAALAWWDGPANYLDFPADAIRATLSGSPPSGALRADKPLSPESTLAAMFPVVERAVRFFEVAVLRLSAHSAYTAQQIREAVEDCDSSLKQLRPMLNTLRAYAALAQSPAPQPHPAQLLSEKGGEARAALVARYKAAQQKIRDAESLIASLTAECGRTGRAIMEHDAKATPPSGEPRAAPTELSKEGE